MDASSLGVFLRGIHAVSAFLAATAMIQVMRPHTLVSRLRRWHRRLFGPGHSSKRLATPKLLHSARLHSMINVPTHKWRWTNHALE